MITVLKLGGELLEDVTAVQRVAAAVVRLSASTSVVIVHGGGRAIDAELRRRALTPKFEDGLRITDADTLDTVVDVLAGRANTQLVAAANGAGLRAVGLTGADAQIGLCVPAAPLRTRAGKTVDLGRVGHPVGTRVTLIADLLSLGYVPVIASIGVTAEGALLNINADTFAAHLAASLGADRLIVAATAAGVLDESGRTIPVITPEAIDSLTASGTAHSGMIAKLAACRHAAASGVTDVSIVGASGVLDFETAARTRVLAPAAARGAAAPSGADRKSERQP